MRVACFVPGDHSTFPVNIDKQSWVGELKRGIRNEKAPEFNDFAADKLTLYRVEIEVDKSCDKQKRIDELERLSRNLNEGKKLDDVEQELSEIFGEGPPEGKKYYILVQVPEGPTHRPELKRLEPSEYPDHTVTRMYERSWGKENMFLNRESENTILLDSDELRAARGVLYVFSQYRYLQKRIDKFRAQSKKYRELVSKGEPTKLLALENPSVVITGTPGTGKTTFLHFYLMWELAQKKPVVYWARNQLYIIAGEDEIYYSPVTDGFTIAKEYWDAVCFIDTDARHPPPWSITDNLDLFILQAASPNPNHTEWMKQRIKAVKFVFNPPDTTEIIAALKIHKSTLDDAEITTAIRNYGVNMRSLRQILIEGQEHVVLHAITDKVNALTLKTVRSMLSIDSETTERTSHSIIMTVSKPPQSDADEHYLHSDTIKRTPSCDVVFKLLLQKHGMDFYRDTQHLAQLFATVPQTSASAGYLWEKHCHVTIPTLPHIDLVPMEVDGNKLVPNTSKERERIMIDMPIPQVYTTKITSENTVDPKNYWIPLSSTNPTFDAFFRCGPKVIGLQMTIGTHHSLKPSGLEALAERLSTTEAKDRYFVFVIPKGHVFSCTKPDDERLSRFTFYILEMKLSTSDFFLKTEPPLDESSLEVAVSIPQKRMRQDEALDGSPQSNKRLRIQDPGSKENESDNESGGGGRRPITKGKGKKNQRQPQTNSAKQPPRRGPMRAVKNR